MIDGSEKRSRQLAFELQNSHVGEKRSKSLLNRFFIFVFCFGQQPFHSTVIV